MAKVNLRVMETAGKHRLTLAEAARQLDMSVDALMQLVYSREVPASLQPGTGRLLLDEVEVERLRSQGQRHSR